MAKRALSIEVNSSRETSCAGSLSNENESSPEIYRLLWNYLPLKVWDENKSSSVTAPIFVTLNHRYVSM